MAGTSATLLAKRWESALLVNVDNDTLTRLMASKEATFGVGEKTFIFPDAFKQGFLKMKGE